MKFVGKGKCDEEIILKAKALQIYRTDYGTSLRVDLEEINGESVYLMDKKVAAAAKKFFGEKVDISLSNSLGFIKLKGVQTLNGKTLYNDADGAPAVKGGIPYSKLTENSFDTIKGTLATYLYEGRKGVYFTAKEFYSD